MSKNIVICLFDGYCVIRPENPNKMLANCTCTLVKTKSGNNILIDTMTPWDGDRIIEGLKVNNVSAKDVSFVISTHGHSDHIGNNNLFLQAKHIVGQNISFRDEYELHDFKDPYIIEDGIEVISTKGHTSGCVSIIVRDGIWNNNEGVIGIVGDLFERFEDIDDDSIWKEAGSENEIAQIQNRSAIADMVNYILPGHGPGFMITEKIRIKLRMQLELQTKLIKLS